MIAKSQHQQYPESPLESSVSQPSETDKRQRQDPTSPGSKRKDTVTAEGAAPSGSVSLGLGWSTLSTAQASPLLRLAKSLYHSPETACTFPVVQLFRRVPVAKSKSTAPIISCTSQCFPRKGQTKQTRSLSNEKRQLRLGYGA